MGNIAAPPGKGQETENLTYQIKDRTSVERGGS